MNIHPTTIRRRQMAAQRWAKFSHLISLEEWAASALKDPPTDKSLRRYAREGAISPAPIKEGNRYFVEPNAKFIGNGRRGYKKKVGPCEFDASAIALPGEEWRPVVGWERYYLVSSLGRIFSRHQTGRLTIGMRVRGNYRVVKVRDGNRKANMMVHRMVLEAFVGPCPVDQEACHGPRGVLDNSAANLRWDTRIANCADKKIHALLRMHA